MDDDGSKFKNRSMYWIMKCLLR